MVECLLMVRWVVELIPHGGPIELLFELVLQDWCNKDHGICNPVSGLAIVKESL